MEASQVLVKTMKLVGAVPQARPVDFPRSRNAVISLEGVIYSFNNYQPTEHSGWMGLSNNPNHLETPPATIDDVALDESVYALWIYYQQLVVTGGSFTVPTFFPLWGLVVPQRQIFFGQNRTTGVIARIEIYYRVLPAPLTLTEAVNRKKGKYRRT